MSLGESNGVHGLGSSFLEDGTPMYNLMMPPPVSSSPSSYQLPAGGEPPLITSAQPSLNPSAPEPAVKKKRGRPRKYAPDGSANAAIISPPPPPPLAVQSAAGGSLSPTGAAAAETAAASPKKKGRGRPPGSGRKNQMAAASLGSAGAGFGFKPHVVTIKAGEDVQAKLMSFSQNTSQAICILSANGAISNVTLRQAATSGGTVTYETYPLVVEGHWVIALHKEVHYFDGCTGTIRDPVSIGILSTLGTGWSAQQNGWFERVPSRTRWSRFRRLRCRSSNRCISRSGYCWKFQH
ncbi:PREDICTED: AT-hook motif nuclear-localized protein 10-like isoform X2 [Ipomoea nil]|uniref:AT-hook motif nuclear-localized protein 10-like isoform X2 n=1 Tax=Ipomoea nil TaxID=35883 RepID=UPI00090132F9|nr:PREDICTED: AT-hook motif nuclear-localized protein 10-like isoform X2 [Ipomoea nil]